MEELDDKLRAFAYWMSGSLRFAGDLAERAASAVGRPPGQPAESTTRGPGLPEYAVQICLDRLADGKPRRLPASLHAAADRNPVPAPAVEPSEWLEPFPDDYYPELPDPGEEKGARYGARESVSFAFLEALQLVPAQLRAAMILQDVMGEGISEVADMLNMGVSNIEGLLRSARGVIADAYNPAAGHRGPPPEEKVTEIFMRYIFNWEAMDLDGLTEQLNIEAVLQLPPSTAWYRGRDAVKSYLAAGPLAGDSRGRWRLLPRRANGQLAFGVYEKDERRGVFEAHSLQVVYFEKETVAEIISFADPWLFSSFGLLPEIFMQG